MNDLSGISGSQRLTSQTRVSLDSAQTIPALETTAESQAMEKLSLEMEQMQYGLALMKEIRGALESALNDLTPR